MSFLSNLKSALSGGGDIDELRTALAAGSTCVTTMMTDPLTSGVIQLGTACLFEDSRNAATFAGIGGATAMGLVFGPVGGTLATAGLLLCNRVIKAQRAELDAHVEQVMHRASAYATK